MNNIFPDFNEGGVVNDRQTIIDNIFKYSINVFLK